MDLEAVKKAYKRYYKVYDLIFGAVFHPGRKAAIEHLHCRPGDRILEVGVGTGLSLPLYPSNVKVVGIDLSEHMLMKAKEKTQQEGLSQVEDLLVMNAQEMSFPDNSFDRVIAMYVASVVPDRKKLVTEIQRVCKPGGTIIFLNHFSNKNKAMQSLENMLTGISNYIGFHPNVDLEEFKQETGFQPHTVVPANVFGYWSIVVGDNNTNPRK